MVAMILTEETYIRADTSSPCKRQAICPSKVPWYTSGFE